MKSKNVQTPIPVPHVFDENDLLVTKKKRRFNCTPRLQLPPQPSYKSSSHYSFRVSLSGQSQKANIVTFKKDQSSQLSPLYDRSSKEIYLTQCFFVEEIVGSGSFGDVFRVKNHLDNSYSAVKVSREKYKGKLDRLEKLQEVYKHELLPEHENLVKLYCAWEENCHLYIQTELCVMSLSTLAENNNNVSEKTVWSCLIDMLNAVNVLHSENLIHLDIKPENIFITRHGRCKLGDFGLVYDLKNGKLKEATEGDPKYLAQEVMEGTYTKAADIFSLGMSILELAFDLDLPSRGPSWHLLRSGKIPQSVFSNKSDDLQTIITMMLRPDYRNRPTVRELLDHPIVKKQENIRRHKMTFKKIGYFFCDSIEHIDQKVHNSNSIIQYLWFILKFLLFILFFPFRFIWKYLFEDDDFKIENIPPNKFNRTYVSTYLERYYQDEISDGPFFEFQSPSPNLQSYTSDDELPDFSDRKLCSTVNRENNSHQFIVPSPDFSPLGLIHSPSINYEMLKSTIKRLSFDDDDDAKNCNGTQITEEESNSRIDSSSGRFSNSLSSRIAFLRKKNVTRKNLLKTFNDLET